jgi:hypothetical protein
MKTHHAPHLARHWGGSSGRADATLAVKCPECGKPKGEICVFVAPKPGSAGYYQNQRDKIARAGKPTLVPHQARYDALRLSENRAHWAAVRAERLAQLPRPDPEILAAQDAMRAADRREYVQLALWLRTFGVELFG